jgi:hypothetical protein
MMLRWQPWKILVLAGGMMIVSIIIPLLMVLQLLQSTFFLNFLSYTLSVAGLMIGMIGVVTMVKLRNKDDD